MSIFMLCGFAGLAIDAGQLYVTKQRAQAAADAAVQAGVMDIYRKLSNGDASAVAYGETHGFTASEILADHPACADLDWCVGHVTLADETPNIIRVTITRTVNTIFMRALGNTASTVTAVASAAISVELQPIPILVLHPTLSGSFSKNGSNTVTICGGPPRSIQVNSSSTTSINISGVSGTVDLSHAGPLDLIGNCTSGTGADFANVGSQNPYPGTLLLGTKPGQYVSPASAIADPLLSVPAPAKPANAPAPLAICGPPSSGALLRCPVVQHGCPAGLGSNDTCLLYSPGYYDSGISISGQVYVQFKSGIYWINHNGFNLGNNSVVRMALSADDDTRPAGWTCPVSGLACMLIYNSPASPVNSSKDTFNIQSNAGQINNVLFADSHCTAGGNCLVGTPTGAGSTYEGVLFFQNHSTATTLSHSFSGGGGLGLVGTIYLSHTAASTAVDGKYQAVTLGGNSGGATKVQGEIVTDVLSLGGTSGVTMNLISSPTFPVRQVALVQ